jgi:hypothetical protein
MRIEIPLAFVLLALPAAAGQSPVEARRPADRPGELELELSASAVTALLGEQAVELAGFPLSDGSSVDLLLERLGLAQLQLGLYVDGERAPGLLDGLDLTVWQGRVAGRDGSQVALSFSQAGAHGWVRLDGALHHLMSRGADEIWVVSEERLLELGGTRGNPCLTDELPESPQEARPLPPAGGQPGGSKAASAPSLYNCPIAIETDWQLMQVFSGDLQAATAYVTSLLTWSSYRYEEQIGTVLTYPYVQFYTSSNDPWSAQDNGGNCIDVLYELQAAWQGNVPAGAEIGHLLSGANLGCGVAWLPGLCNSPYNFSVSGNINGNLSFPIQVSPSNWDFMVMTHELGHNFNAPHTHNYCPPLDECAPPGYFGQCQTQQQCTNQGTLMSYCHLCQGGLANITTYFHPSSVADMRGWVEATCLPLYAPDPVTYCVSKLNSAGCAPAIGWEGHPTLSGLDDFAVTAEDIINNQNGLLFYGPGSANIPFQGGTLCVASPIKRTTVQASGGTPPPGKDCTGTYRLEWDHDDLNLLGAGSTIYCQYWYRDSAAQAGSGLTDALSFVITN